MALTTKLSKKMLAAIETGDPEIVLEALTIKQQRFCHEYLKDLNASKACLRAGYETNNPNRVGPELKNHPAVKVALKYLLEERNHKMNVDANFVLDKIIKSIERAEAKGNEASVLRGAELLAKHLGMFVDRQEISGPNCEAIHVKEEQLRQTAEEFKNKIVSLSRKSNNALKLVENEEED